ASEDGLTLSSLPDGTKLEKCGPEVAPASRGQARLAGDLKAPKTTATYGQSGANSLLQGALERSLASRLPMAMFGLIVHAATWKPWFTKSGRRFCRLSVSAKIMRDFGFTLLATPTATANQACA